MNIHNTDANLAVATGTLLLTAATATYFFPSTDPEIRVRPIADGVSLIKVKAVNKTVELTRDEAIESFKRTHPELEILGAFQVNLNSKDLKGETYSSELTWVIMTNQEPTNTFGQPKP